jgi:two-component system, NtrC family, nitrogen regulation sensor histidine kinase NtrY
LTPMKLSIQYMQQAVQRDPERLEELVKRVSETLLEQVENLSAIATTFSNFGTLPKANNQKINLNEVAASVHDLFRKREDIEINLYVPIEDIWVFGDRNFMLRVLNNLIKNAIQAIPADRQGIIDIRLVKTKEIAQIVIKDNGIGIPDSMKDNVFEPNFTTKTSGTGLGLAICASLLESFNGTIYFETVPNEGTTFFVELPLMRFEDNFSHIPRVSLDD